MKLGRILLAIVTVAASAALVLSYSSRFISPSALWYTALFGLAYFPILLVFLLLTVLWFFVHKRVFWILLVLLLIGWPAHRTSFAMGKKNTEPADSLQTFSVATFNTKGFDLNAKEPDRESVMKTILEADADIICLQEFNSWKKEGMPNNRQEIADGTGLPYQYYHKSYENRKKTRSYGLIIYSRFPILKYGELDYPAISKLNTTIWADVLIHGDTIRLFSTHLQSNQLTHSDFEFIDQTGNSDTLSFEPARVAGKLRDSYQLRAEQVEVIRQAIDASPHPVLFCGDFNDTPVSYAYRKISEGLDDAFLHCGRGLGATYSPAPLIRIDYMLYTPAVLRALDYERRRSAGSDHYLVRSVFSLQP